MSPSTASSVSAMLTEFKGFFEENDLAKKAAKSIKDGREIEILVPDAGPVSDAPLKFTFTKESGRNVLRDGAPTSPDLTFTLPKAAADEILTTPFESVGQVGLRIFEKMLSSDPKQKVRAKVHVGFLSLLSGGYLGVLVSGGGDVARFLASKGLSSAGKIKDVVSKMKNG
ncbi:MAG: hypothetical protein HYW49_00960 [Deltaproteobacteria bacterium]|nr:hypothetical protein [Deltaproteobacteria bacterium]